MLRLAPLLILVAVAPALAQTPAPPADAAPPVLHTALPAPNLTDDASPRDFLLAARSAIIANRLPEAQEALERAEARALVRAVRPSRITQPSDQDLVRQIAATRQALTGGDRMVTVALLQQALANPDAAAP